MPKPRFSGGSVSIRVPSSQIAPAVSGSRPARQLSAVDLPQPDGPSRAMNSPASIVRSRSRSASVPAEAARDALAGSSCWKLGHFFTFAPPISRSHRSNAVDLRVGASSDGSFGLPAISSSYSGAAELADDLLALGGRQSQRARP